jgi:hypothetical protein
MTISAAITKPAAQANHPRRVGGLNAQIAIRCEGVLLLISTYSHYHLLRLSRRDALGRHLKKACRGSQGQASRESRERSRPGTPEPSTDGQPVVPQAEFTFEVPVASDASQQQFEPTPGLSQAPCLLAPADMARVPDAEAIYALIAGTDLSWALPEPSYVLSAGTSDPSFDGSDGDVPRSALSGDVNAPSVSGGIEANQDELDLAEVLEIMRSIPEVFKFDELPST